MEITAVAVLFDADGVLIDSLPRVDAAWTAWARSFDLNPAPILSMIHGRPAAEAIAEAAPHLDVDAAFARLLDMELATVPGTVPLPGAHSLTASLAHAPWAVVTSASRRLAEARLGEVGIAPPVLVTADDVPRGKPDPAPYLEAAARVGVPPARCLVFEDAPAGITAARAAGATVIAVTVDFDGRAAGADDQVPDLAAVTITPGPSGALVVQLTR